MPHLPLVRIALISTFLTLAGCGRSPEEKLAGRWVGDRIDNVSADQVARATGWVKGTMFEFAGDKLTVTVPAEPARTTVRSALSAPPVPRITETATVRSRRRREETHGRGPGRTSCDRRRRCARP